MEEDDDNITEIQDGREQKITEKFQKESGNKGIKPCTSQDKDKVLLNFYHQLPEKLTEKERPKKKCVFLR